MTENNPVFHFSGYALVKDSLDCVPLDGRNVVNTISPNSYGISVHDKAMDEALKGSEFLILDEPTRGIDVGAIEFIRKKIVDMRSRKKAILLVSADLSEILSLSDTILVMHEGRIVGHIADVKKTSENELGLYMLGVKEDSKEQIGGACCE